MSVARRLMLTLIVFILTPIIGATSYAASPTVTIRVGDVLSLSFPSEVSLNKDFTVDSDGAVVLPEVGPVLLSGLTLDVAGSVIRQALGKAFRDVDRLSVTFKERRLIVTVAGYVKQPGRVELPGDASVQSAIAAAGGLSQGAQLDRLKVRRGDQEFVFDYKKYLDSGDQSILPVLQPLDTIFVPASPLTGNVQIDFDGRTLAAAGDGAEERTSIKVFGEVNTAASFAYRPGSTVIDMIMRAGGVTRFASVDHIRIINDGSPILFNLQAYLDNGDKALLPPIQPGATIFVPKQLEEIRSGKHTVYVMGEVAKPGAFDTKEDTSFVDVLANAGGPTRFADTRQIRILRADGRVTMFDMSSFTEGKGAVPPSIGAGDAILIPERTETQEPSWLKLPPERAVQVMGAVLKPNRYEWSDEMSILDLLAQAGGPTARANIANIQILQNEKDTAQPILFDLANFLKSGGELAKLPRIRGGFVIMVPELPQDPGDNKAQWTRQASDQSIYVMGQVGAPGRYAFNAELNFLDIITAANGPTATADLRNIRVSHRGAKKASVTNVNLARYFETGDERLLPKVKVGDVIFVPDRNRDWLDNSKETTIRVLGAVGKPGRYHFSDEMTILDLLAEAGGPTEAAMQDKIVIVNMSERQDQARVFDLVTFAKSGDHNKLPVLRAGDTLYVPNTEQGEWHKATSGAASIFPFLAIFSLAKGF